VLFSSKEDAVKATQELNQAVVGDKHIRVDIDGKNEAEKNDFETSVFIGNLPWVVNEEDLRAHFEECGKILNVRVIRDKDTFIGKGIAYIQFASPAEMKKALEAKNNSLFKGRNLRVRRATPSERREKKQEKKREEKQHRKEEHRDRKNHKHSRKPRHNNDDNDDNNKKLDKDSRRELKKITPFLKSNEMSHRITNDSVDMKNRIAYRGKKDKMRVQQELVESRDGKTSRAQKFNDKVLKPQPTLNQMLR
jgi:nucleolar protein 12